MEAGDGEVVAARHGRGSSDTWHSLFPLRARRYRVIAPDLLTDAIDAFISADAHERVGD